MRCCSRRVGASDAAEMSLAENDDVIIARARHVEKASARVERGDRGRTPKADAPLPSAKGAKRRLDEVSNRYRFDK
jgi:hypothetical protein